MKTKKSCRIVLLLLFWLSCSRSVIRFFLQPFFFISPPLSLHLSSISRTEQVSELTRVNKLADTALATIRAQSDAAMQRANAEIAELKVRERESLWNGGGILVRQLQRKIIRM